MKIASSLINFCSFNPGNSLSKNPTDRFVQFSTITVTSLLFLAILSTISFVTADMLTGSILITSFALQTLLLVVAFSAQRIKYIAPAAVIIQGTALLAALLLGQNGHLVLWVIMPLPAMAIASFRTPVNLAVAVIYLLMLVVVLFLPVEINRARLIDPSVKALFLAIYPATLFTVSLLFFHKAKRIKEAEELLLQQESESRHREAYFAQLSHQIRTQLNNVMVISNMLTGASLEEKYKDMVDAIQTSINSLVNTLNSMVEMSGGDFQAQADVNINFNLNSTIDDTVKLFSAQAQKVNLSAKVDRALPRAILGDPVKLKQIFLNVIESIIKNKSSDKISIDITVSPENQMGNSIALHFEVRSNTPLMLRQGDGYTQSIVSDTNITQANSQRYIDLLELNITKKLVQSNGGSLSLRLTSNDAAISFIYNVQVPTELAEPAKPKAKTAEQEDVTTVMESATATNAPVRTPKPPAPAKQQNVDLGNANVLLVEDNLINQKIVILSLKKMVKSIEVANNGKEALDKFGTSKYDIILMDIQMPIMNGYVTTRKIREIEASANSHTPIIAITANALLGDREECLAAGMDDYISKPFQIEVLIQKMETLLRSN